nr:hypothetical protein [Tanacetum cinerariifolium]
TRNPLSQKLENENVELEFQVLNYARENAHLKATYKNLFDSIFVSRNQTKTIIASLQNELQSTIFKNAKLKTQLFKKVSDQKDNTHDTSENTKFAKQLIMENLPKVGETHALSTPVTSNSVSTPQEPKVMKNDKVFAPGIFRIYPNKTSRETKNVPNIIRASDKKKPITVSQPPVITKKDGTVRFGNDHVAAILCFGQFYDSDLEVAFRRNACFIRNLDEVNLLKGDRSTNLYTINRHEIASASPICLMARASFTKSWLWHQRNIFVLPVSKEKAKKASHPPKPVPNSRSKDEAPVVIITFSKRIMVLLQSPVIIIRTDNNTEFKNHVLKDYFDTVGISH